MTPACTGPTATSWISAPATEKKSASPIVGPPGGKRTGLSHGWPSGSMPVLLADFALEMMRRRAIRRQRRIGIPDRGGTDRDFAPRIIGNRRRAGEFRRRCPEARSAATAGHRDRCAQARRDETRRYRGPESAEIGSGAVLRVVAKGIRGQPAKTAAALPIASESESGIHTPSTSSRAVATRRSGAPNG